MLLENEEEIRNVLTHQLTQAGYEVVCPVDSYVGLECASQHPFDLIMLSEEMPLIDGPGFLESVRSAGFKGPAIVFFRARLDASKSDIMAAAPCLWIQKPFQIDALLKQIESQLNT